MIDAEGHNRKMQELPIWEKPLLTVVKQRNTFKSVRAISDGSQENIRTKTSSFGKTIGCIFEEKKWSRF